MKILRLSSLNQEKIIKKTLAVLKSGGLVVFPSDTVYGLLCDAANPTAVDKLLKFKERPAGKAISVFVAGKVMADKYVIINLNAANIIKNLLPGPFTLICHKARPCTARPRLKHDICSARTRLAGLQGESLKKVDPRLFAENGTLGFRIPDYPLILELVKQFGKPLTATSANKSGTPPHYSIESFLGSAGCHPAGTQGDTLMKNKKFDLIDLIINAGKLPYNKPSTVIDTTSGELKTLRMGDLLPATPNSLISRSEKNTSELARFILSKVSKNASGKPIVFLLKGNLGTGKTIFTKGLAKALGIKETVVSPTYTLCYEYRIPNEKSTNIPQLSTVQPIINSRGFDTKGLYQNINNVEHNSKSGLLCHPDQAERAEGSLRNTRRDASISVGMTNESVRMTEENLNPLLIHYDLYRIESPEDLNEIKFFESIKPGNLYSIEWPERIDEETLLELKKIAQIVYIKIKHLDENTREFSWGE